MNTPQKTKTTNTYPICQEQIPKLHHASGSYLLRFADNQEDLNAVARLRYCVFNLELDEGLDASHATGMDLDEFDPHCHHVLLECDGEVVGTYRMQTRNMANTGHGFYTRTEFDLSVVPEPLLDSALELGRACLSPDHRNGRSLFLLWKAVLHYLEDNQLRYLFGCCSLPSQNPQEGRAATQWLHDNKHMHPEYDIRPQPNFECTWEEDSHGTVPDITIPKLMKLYLMYGCKICGNPAIDREFKTIDYFALLDMENLSPLASRVFSRATA